MEHEIDSWIMRIGGAGLLSPLCTPLSRRRRRAYQHNRTPIQLLSQNNIVGRNELPLHWLSTTRCCMLVLASE